MAAETADRPRPIAQLRPRLRGPVLCPGDPGFDDATSVWNGLIAKTPALVVRPTGTADVVAAVDVRARARPGGRRSAAAATTSPAPRSPTAA